MKVMCEMIGGPFAGTHESDFAKSSDPVRAWGWISDNFTVGKRFQTVSPGATPALQELTPAKVDRTQAHKYEVTGREERDGVIYVRCEYLGAS